MVIYNFFKSIYQHIKYTRILDKVYKNEDLLENLSKLFGQQFKKDWVGRVYTVVNPYLTEGKFDGNSHIFELDDNGNNYSEYVKQYIMQKLVVADRFIYTNNLFDLLTYDIKRLDDFGNYLFIMKPITYDDAVKYSKRFAILLALLTLIGIGMFIYIKLN